MHNLHFPCLTIVNDSFPPYCTSSRSKTIARKSFGSYKHSTFEDRNESQATRMLFDEGRAVSEEIRSCSLASVPHGWTGPCKASARCSPSLQADQGPGVQRLRELIASCHAIQHVLYALLIYVLWMDIDVAYRKSPQHTDLKRLYILDVVM